MIQQRFGRFTILRRLGRSMTDVYLARDERFERKVVLKVIEGCGDGPAQLAVECESRGARIQQQLRLRNKRILDVYEYGQHEGCFYVALEYFPGRTLAEILVAEGRLEPKRAAGYAAEICRQLRTLHEFSLEEDGRKTAIIHGDIKPSNIQIGEGDELRLLDFGIAKLIRPGHDLTQHDLGSPSYCSPERLRNSRVDIHSDLWAVGVTLYEMVAGAPPYQAHNTRELEKLIQSGRRPAALLEGCPAELKALLRKALAGELRARYPSAEALAVDLEAFVNAPEVSPNSQPARPGEVTLKKTRVAQPAISPADSQKKAPPIGKRSADRWSLSIALLAGVLAGLMLLAPIAYYLRLDEITHRLSERKNYAALPEAALASDWQRYQTVAHESAWARTLTPAGEGVAAFRKSLLDSAENLIAQLRRSSDDPLRFNWQRVRLLLWYAYEIDPHDRRAEGELWLADGYLQMKDADSSNASRGWKQFHRAAALLPRSPDPHLGLARLCALNLHNLPAALSELRQAEIRGYRLGEREWQEEADAYLYRAEWELNRGKRLAKSTAQQESSKWLQLARADLEQACNLYEPITSFSHAGASLERVYDDQDEQAKWETALLQPVRPPKAHMVLLKMRYVSRTGSSRWR